VAGILNQILNHVCTETWPFVTGTSRVEYQDFVMVSSQRVEVNGLFTETKVLYSGHYKHMVKCPELSSDETEGDDQSQTTLVLKIVIPAVLHLVKLRREQDIYGTKQEKVCQCCLNKTDISV
jgi:hypothetical protein